MMRFQIVMIAGIFWGLLMVSIGIGIGIGIELWIGLMVSFFIEFFEIELEHCLNLETMDFN